MAQGRLPAARWQVFIEGIWTIIAGTSRSHWAALSQSWHQFQNDSPALSCPAIFRTGGKLPLPHQQPAQGSQLGPILQVAGAALPLMVPPGWHLEQEPRRSEGNSTRTNMTTAEWKESCHRVDQLRTSGVTEALTARCSVPCTQARS